MSFFNRIALLSASAIMAGSAGLLGAIPAQAATAHTNAVRPDGIGGIVCSGDLCIQSNSCNPARTEVSIAEWADKGNFFGHFELEDPNGVDYNSSQENWIAGGEGNLFTVPLFFGAEYHGIAWAYNPSNGQYTNIGEVNFTVNNC